MPDQQRRLHERPAGGGRCVSKVLQTTATSRPPDPQTPSKCGGAASASGAPAPRSGAGSARMRQRRCCGACKRKRHACARLDGAPQRKVGLLLLVEGAVGVVLAQVVVAHCGGGREGGEGRVGAGVAGRGRSARHGAVVRRPRQTAAGCPRLLPATLACAACRRARIAAGPPHQARTKQHVHVGPRAGAGEAGEAGGVLEQLDHVVPGGGDVLRATRGGAPGWQPCVMQSSAELRQSRSVQPQAARRWAAERGGLEGVGAQNAQHSCRPRPRVRTRRAPRWCATRCPRRAPRATAPARPTRTGCKRWGGRWR